MMAIWWDEDVQRDKQQQQLLLLLFIANDLLLIVIDSASFVLCPSALLPPLICQNDDNLGRKLFDFKFASRKCNFFPFIIIIIIIASHTSFNLTLYTNSTHARCFSSKTNGTLWPHDLIFIATFTWGVARLFFCCIFYRNVTNHITIYHSQTCVFASNYTHWTYVMSSYKIFRFKKNTWKNIFIDIVLTFTR